MSSTAPRSCNVAGPGRGDGRSIRSRATAPSISGCIDVGLRVDRGLGPDALDGPESRSDRARRRQPDRDRGAHLARGAPRRSRPPATGPSSRARERRPVRRPTRSAAHLRSPAGTLAWAGRRARRRACCVTDIGAARRHPRRPDHGRSHRDHERFGRGRSELRHARGAGRAARAGPGARHGRLGGDARAARDPAAIAGRNDLAAAAGTSWRCSRGSAWIGVRAPLAPPPPAL